MGVRSHLHLSLLVIALVNVLPAVQAEESWGVLSIFVGAATISCLAYDRAGRPRCPRWLIHIAVLSSVGYLIHEMFGKQEEATVYVLDLAHFLIFLCCCKFFEIRAGRDLGAIAVIAFLLLAISGLVSASLFFGLALLTDLTAGVAWTMKFLERQDLEQLASRRAALRKLPPPWAIPAVSPEPETSAPAAGPQAGRQHSWIRPAAACSLGLFILCVAIFVSVPRGWGRGLFGRFRQLGVASLAGIDDQVRLSDSRVIQDLTPVLRARFSKSGQPLTDEDFQPYLRGLTFDRYHGGQWQRTPSVSEATLAAGSPRDLTPLTGMLGELAPDRTVEQEIWLDEINDGTLFAIFPAVAFGSSDIDRVHQDRRDLTLRARRSDGNGIHYVIHSSRPEAGPSPASGGIRPRLPRDGPSSISPGVARLARNLAARYGDPTDATQHGYLARRIRDYLRSGDFEYTLNRGRVGSEGGAVDPIEDFLLENRRGHCEYFASAMAILCQAVGIRARLASGYFGGEYNDVGGYWQFRRKDSHAWVEVYVPNRGWESFDPTPAVATAARGQEVSIGLRLRRLVEYVYFRWSLFVVSFDADSRERILDRLHAWLAHLELGGGADRSFWGALHAFIWGPEVLTLWQRALYWLLLVLFTTLCLLLLRVLWILSLMFREHLHARSQHKRGLARRPEARFYDRLLLLLAAKGHVKPAHLTPREFAATLARKHKELIELPVFTEWFYGAQYGSRPLAGGRWERLQAFLQLLREGPAFGAR